MNYLELTQLIADKRSFLCVGLDPDLKKMPTYLQSYPVAKAITQFNQGIIDATAPYAVAFKINFAFHESEGLAGLTALANTIDYIKTNYPDIFVIADAKHGDIGNASERYAKSVFEGYKADAVTISPYMGKDSVAPFLNYRNKWAVLPTLTSNESCKDFQLEENVNGIPLYLQVLQQSLQWGSVENTMFVIGATHAEILPQVRKIAPRHFLLIPDVGAQDGRLRTVAQYGMNREFCSLLVNFSRDIIYAGHDHNFSNAAQEKAAEMQQEMDELLNGFSLL